MAEKIRKAEKNDIPEISIIIDQAKAFLKVQEIDQWQNGYPSENEINNDVENNEGYVLLVDNKIAGYAYLNIGIDDAYEKITGGNWGNKYSNYAAIHRLAVSNQYRGQGLAKKFIELLIAELVERDIFDIRIDTHPENKIVQKMATDLNFKFRGEVIYEGKRKAYQLENE